MEKLFLYWDSKVNFHKKCLFPCTYTKLSAEVKKKLNILNKFEN